MNEWNTFPLFTLTHSHTSAYCGGTCSRRRYPPEERHDRRNFLNGDGAGGHLREDTRRARLCLSERIGVCQISLKKRKSSWMPRLGPLSLPSPRRCPRLSLPPSLQRLYSSVYNSSNVGVKYCTNWPKASPLTCWMLPTKNRAQKTNYRDWKTSVTWH